MLNRHCVSFFRVAVFTSRVVRKWNYHRICSESTFMKQDVSHQNSLETCFYRLLKHLLFFAAKACFDTKR